MLPGGGILQKDICGGPMGSLAGDDGAESEDDPDMIKPKQTKISLRSNQAEGPAMKKVRTREWGRFSPNQRFNGDQVPSNLDQSACKVFLPAASAEHAQLPAPSRADTRFGTLQMFMHPGENEQPKLGMIFFGKGNVMKAEEHAYHHAVVVARHTFVICVSCFRIPRMPGLEIP